MYLNRPTVLIPAYAVFVVVAMAAPVLAPVRAGHVAVVVAPNAPADRVLSVVAAAGGTLLSGTSASWVVIANGTQPDFVDRLYEAGALAVINASTAFGCAGDGRTVE